MKELFSTPRVHILNKYILYQVICQPKSYKTTLHGAIVVHFSEKLFWVMKAISEASTTNSIINLSHTLYVIADAKALCSILYSCGNIQIKRCLGRQRA